MENYRCNCCGSNKGNWGMGQNQNNCKDYGNYKKDGHKYCCYCWEEKDCSSCGCSHQKHQNKNCNCGCEYNNKYENYSNCNNNNYGYGKYEQNNFGWY